MGAELKNIMDIKNQHFAYAFPFLSKESWIVAFIAIVFCITIAPAKQAIAVYKISTEGSSYQEIIVSDFIESELIKIRSVTVVSRNQMDLILKEQGFQQSGVCEKSDCLVQVGQLLGVDRIITGSLFERAGVTYLQLKSINVIDGKISGSALIRTESVLLDYPIFDDLEKLLGIVSNKVTAQTLPSSTSSKEENAGQVSSSSTSGESKSEKPDFNNIGQTTGSNSYALNALIFVGFFVAFAAGIILLQE